MIGIGIHPNVTLLQPEINEYGGLNLTFQKKAQKLAVDANISAEDLMFGEVPESAGSSFDEENKVGIYALKSTDYKGNQVTLEDFIKDRASFQAQLEHILTSYGVEIPKWAPFTGISPIPTAQDLIKSDEILATISKNYFTQFIQALSKADLAQEFRVIFPRKSKGSKYPGLRKNLLKDYPFMESMEVPEDQSKLKFTPNEIKKGLDKPLEVTPDANAGGDVSSLFGVETPAEAGDLGLPFSA